MGQFNKKNKLFNLFQTQISNEINLGRKKTDTTKQYLPSISFKKTGVLYDSGWLNVTNSDDANILGPGIDQDPNAFGSLHFSASATTIKNQTVPVSLFFSFMQDLKLSEEWMPFVKSTLMVKSHPKVKATGVFKYVPSVYDTQKYVRVKGDGTLIYQGFNPFSEKHSQTEIDNGDLSSALTSKWFRGNVSFTDGANNWDYNDTNLLSISTYYDGSLSGAPGGDKYDYKVFVVNAIDSISGSSVSGTGTLEEHLWEEDEDNPGVWTENVTTTRNITMSAPFLEDITIISVKFGVRFRNGIFQGSVGSSGVALLTDGSLQSAVNVPSFDRVGTISRASVTHSLVHESVIDEPSNHLFRLWYDNKRAMEFKISGTYVLQNLPFTGAYQTESLPYGQLSVEVNPDPFPAQHEGNESYHRGHRTEAWGQITPDSSEDKTFRYFTTGTIQLTAPASLNIGTTASFVDETYTNHGDGFYENDGDTRDPKEIDRFVPEQLVVQFRLTLTLSNPKYYKDLKGYQINVV